LHQSIFVGLVVQKMATDFNEILRSQGWVRFTVKVVSLSSLGVFID